MTSSYDTPPGSTHEAVDSIIGTLDEKLESISATLRERVDWVIKPEQRAELRELFLALAAGEEIRRVRPEISSYFYKISRGEALTPKQFRRWRELHRLHGDDSVAVELELIFDASERD